MRSAAATSSETARILAPMPLRYSTTSRPTTIRMAATKVSIEKTPILMPAPNWIVAVHPAAGDFARIVAVDLKQSILDDVGEAKGDEDDEQAVLADDALEQEALQRETDAKRDRQHDDGRCHRIEAKADREGQQRKAGQYDEVAMGDVDKAHDASRERQAGGKQRVQAAEQHALQQLIDP